MLYIYIKIMALAQKKLVSVYLDELQYMAFQRMSKQQNCNTADLIRKAMDSYLASSKKSDSLDDWQPLSVGGLLSDAPDWKSSDIQDEMSGAAYDWH